MCFRYPFDVFKCGKCPECLEDIRRDWSVRLQLHTYFSGELPYFCHLTYDNKHVPSNEFGNLTLSRRDVQLFIMRLRMMVYKYNLNKYGKKENFPEDTKRIKYFLAGEYGPSGTHRPHYHCVIFGLPKGMEEEETRTFIQKAWKNGDVRKRSCYLKDYSQLHYATKYMINYFNEDFSLKQAPFKLCSSGFGQPFLDFAKESNLYNVELQKLFKCDYVVSKISGHKIPVRWHNEQPILHDEFGYPYINPILREFRDFIEFEAVEKGTPRVHRYPLPRYFQERLYTEDFRSALSQVKKFRLSEKNSKYHSDNMENDKFTDVPMWLQLKRYIWEHKRKNKKDKNLKISSNDILND